MYVLPIVTVGDLIYEMTLVDLPIVTLFVMKNWIYQYMQVFASKEICSCIDFYWKANANW